ncbi:DUF3078 domain-containing protein [Arachidicoccus ginsenosidivorans]|jgi:hypothetical protein|uniref:DUF3078 domain-containing protein n=1 Tax=Arachidicoccus ginsenosidivorans TaxID=496057 RepID=A0A5B8VMN2_9BACT|nr:DUF3078 domain-containing protein [Arachidicoccus ginsenosidivorans]QEC72797.1 DUF3078 domain-containing protein [Arachidicoccus ginsenosidivorans]
MKKLLLGTFLLAAAVSYAQDNGRTDIKSDLATKVDKNGRTYDSTKNWNKGGSLSVNVAQTSLGNWSGGGTDALSANAFVNLYADYLKGKNSWTNNLNMQYGYLKTSGLDGRKSADLIDFVSLYGHSVSSKMDVSALFRLRTQGFKGYTYGTDADGNETKTLNSNFFAPAYITLAPGITYKPFKNFNLFLSPVAARALVVADDFLSNQGAYGVDSGKTMKFQLGFLLNAGYTADITKTISYTGNLELYSNYLQDPQNIYIFMTNTFAAKLTKAIAVTWNFNLAYDDLYRPVEGKGPKLQTQSILGVGLLYKL